MSNTVVGFFDNAEEAQNAVQSLTEAGFERSEIDVSSGGSGSGIIGSTKGTITDSTSSSAAATGEHTGNAIARFFHSLFGNDSDEAARFSRVGQSAHTIITVHTDSEDEGEDAANILDEAGAINVDERAAGNVANTYTGKTGNASAKALTGDVGNTGDKIERVEEELQVGKRSVQTGGVRVRSRVIERPVEESLRLREEHVNVERNPVNRTLNTDDYAAFEEKNIELTEFAEVPVVNKEARVVEEIRINKNSTERDETVRDTVRKTEVDIENIDSGKNLSANKNRYTDSGRLDKDSSDRV